MRVIISALAGLFLAAVIVSFSWGFTIHEKAFHCQDDTGAFLGFIGGIEDHQQARDVLSPGWTWGKIERVRILHFVAFWILAACPILVAIRPRHHAIESPTTSSGSISAR
jgi:hypothetical protein